jgi:uncharacterized SAM-binding protein YcdF (DUF218 family)
LAILAALHSVLFSALGHYLIAADTPIKADAALVLAGDSNALRIERAAALAEQGYVPKVLVSGPALIYGVSEADLAINLMVRRGHSAREFEAVHFQADSTEVEAERFMPELARRGIKSILLVTSDYHTRRAGAIWRRHAKSIGLRVTVVSSPDRYFTADGWWKSRSGRKTAFMEWVKTLTGPLGV